MRLVEFLEGECRPSGAGVEELCASVALYLAVHRAGGNVVRLRPALVWRALGVRAELKPNGAKLGRDGMWGLLAAAVEQSLKRGEELELPPPGISLLRKRPERATIYSK